MAKIDKKEIIKYLQTTKKIVCPLGDINLEKIIGEGGTAIVYKAVLEMESFSKNIAIKFLAENIAKEKTRAFLRFKQSYLNLLYIQTDAPIVPQWHFNYLSISKEIEFPYTIMPLMNKTLKDFCIENEITPSMFLNIFKHLLNAIDKIHSLKIIHRDLKPENIFIDNHKLLIGDFDISCFLAPENIKLIKTEKSERLANWSFSAPEQSQKNGEITEASDWYAFGQILY